MINMIDWSKDVETIDSKVYEVIGKSQYHKDGSILLEGLIDIRTILKDTASKGQTNMERSPFELANKSHTLIHIPSDNYIGIEFLNNGRLKHLIKESEQFLRKNSKNSGLCEVSSPVVRGLVVKSKGSVYNYHGDSFLFVDVNYKDSRKKSRHIFINYGSRHIFIDSYREIIRG